MEIYKILVAIIENPHAIKCYLDLQKYYKKNHMDNEIEAMNNLIEKRFGKNEKFIDNSDNN